jgi:hypothetical protein
MLDPPDKIYSAALFREPDRGRWVGPEEPQRMFLKDCILDVDQFVGAPFSRTEPEERWLSARDSGKIPQELFDLYEAAGFLSFQAGCLTKEGRTDVSEHAVRW